VEEKGRKKEKYCSERNERGRGKLGRSGRKDMEKGVEVKVEGIRKINMNRKKKEKMIIVTLSNEEERRKI